MQPAATTVVVEQSDAESLPDTLGEVYALMEDSFRIGDPTPLPSDSNNRHHQLRISSFSHGEVDFTRIQGFGFAVELEPLQARCTLALPAGGHVHCRVDHHELVCAAGQSIGFLPARSWHLTNRCRAGLGIHLTEESLLTRLVAMCGREMPVPALSRLNQPMAIALSDGQTSAAYQQLLMALRMLDEIISTTGEIPHAFLNLDDLILRTIVLLLFPEITAQQSEVAAESNTTDLQLAIRGLMAWMLANLNKPISLTDIESRSNYGRRTIQIGFNREVGCGPMQWLRRQRLEAAYRQLQSSTPNLTVSAVARQYGYVNLSCFSRDFTEMFKCTPSSLLRKARKPSP